MKLVRLKGKYKGKTGKVIPIEDIIGTEPLKGTYEDREKVTREMDRQDMMRHEFMRKRYEEARKKKEEELRKQLVDNDKIELINNQMTYILYNTLEPDAYVFLDYLRINEPDTCGAIIKIIFTDFDMSRLGDYVRTIENKGRPRNQIKYVYLQKLYRKIKNIKPSIKIEEDGKRIDIGEKFSGRKII